MGEAVFNITATDKDRVCILLGIWLVENKSQNSISSPCQRQCELLPSSLGVCRPKKDRRKNIHYYNDKVVCSLYWFTCYSLLGQTKIYVCLRSPFVETVLWRVTQFFYLLCSQFRQKASGWINKTLLLIKQQKWLSEFCVKIDRVASKN
jgi:hypothetical protein